MTWRVVLKIEPVLLLCSLRAKPQAPDYWLGPLTTFFIFLLMLRLLGQDFALCNTLIIITYFCYQNLAKYFCPAGLQDVKLVALYKLWNTGRVSLESVFYGRECIVTDKARGHPACWTGPSPELWQRGQYAAQQAPQPTRRECFSLTSLKWEYNPLQQVHE